MGGSGTNVLVAPWGDPSGWREVSYRYEGREAIKSITSLIPILCNEDIGKVVILVQDSVIFTQPKKTGVNDIARKCGKCYGLLRECGDDKSEAIWKDIAKVQYSDIVDTAREYVRCIVEKAIENAKSTCGKELKELSIDVVVVPSIGTFSIKCGGLDQTVRFDGNFDLMYSIALLGLYDALSGVNDVRRVLFDSTHGVNYFTIMSMMAAQDILSILAFRNAWNGRDMPRLTIYNAIPESPSSYLITKISTQLPSIRQLEEESINELPSPIRVFYNALIHNAPLALYHLKEEPEKPSVGNYRDFICKVDVNTEKGIVYNFEKQTEKDRNETYLKLLFNEVVKSINEPSHEELQRLAESLYEMVSKASQTIIINELNNIYYRIKRIFQINESSCEFTTRLRLSDILGTPTEATRGMTEKTDKSIELRHLTAHAGLLKDYTIVNIAIEKENNKTKIIFKYDNWNHIKTLLDDA